MAEPPKTDKIPLNALIIHPSIEPGVIDNKRIIQNVLAGGPTEEAGRLFAEEGVHFDETEVIRFEFQNILRIDHVWMLTNLTKLTLAHNLIEKIENLDSLVTLKELDLSFNKISKIENLDALVNLEVLTLYHNMIRKLENMDTLEKLMIFSIGENLIDDYKEVVYLRDFRFLRSLSFKLNPCCNDPQTNCFIAAGLPRIKFLDYKLITPELVQQGVTIFRGVMRLLDETDELKEKKRIAKEEYDKQVEFYAMSFVEYLSGPELLLDMFNKDVDGTILLSFGGPLLGHFETYKQKYVETMSELVEFAQEAYKDREREIKLFKDLVEGALADSIAKSKEAVAEFEKEKKIKVARMNELIVQYNSDKHATQEVEASITVLNDEFNDIVYNVWKTLMTIELRLFEQCEESRVQFAVNMEDKMTKLKEVARNAFGAWREYDGDWSMKQFEILSSHIGTSISSIALYDAVPELIAALKDRDQMMNLVAASSDNHMRFIDTREDVLSSRSDAWLTNVVEGTTDSEIQRNRNRIAEINFFCDNQRAEWHDLQMCLTETNYDPEAVALFAEDF